MTFRRWIVQLCCVCVLPLILLRCETLQRGPDHEFLTREVDKNHRAYLFFDISSIKLNRDLSYSIEIHRLFKIVDESFIEYLANSEITYSRGEEKFAMLVARTVKPDGRIININRKHIVESRKYYEYPAYDDLMTVKFSYQNVEKGDLLELKYRVLCKNKYMGGHFDYAKVLAGYYPAQIRELRISYPRSVSLKHKIVARGFSVEHDRSSQGDEVTEKFITRDTPGYQFETGMPGYSDIGPHVIVSTYERWTDIAKWYSSLSSGVYVTNDDMKSLVARLKKEASGDMLLLSRRLFAFVAKKVRYVGLWFGDGGVKSHPATQVFENLYGDCKDKTTLLVALMREAGIRAWPVLVSSQSVPLYFPDFPAMIFNHVITGLEVKGQTHYVDPTSTHGVFNYLPVECQGRYSLEISDNSRFFSLPYALREANGSEYHFDLDLDDSGGVVGMLRIRLKGESAASFRDSIHGLKEKEAKQKIRLVLLTLIPGIEVRRFFFKKGNPVLDPFEISVEFLSHKYFERVDDLLIVPAKLIFFKRPDLVSSKTRLFPMEFRAFWSHQTVFNYTFPANYLVRNLPRATTVDNPFFTYVLKIEKPGKKKNVVTLREHFYAKKLLIEPHEYLVFKRDYDRILHLEKKYLVIQRKRGKRK